MTEASIKYQTKLVLENLADVLKAGGMDMKDVGSRTMLTTNLDDFSKMNAVYANVFKSHLRARATTQVNRPPGDVQIEISVIAVKSNSLGIRS
jgi:enamine deaminase RidA (YjgF/YER057c/UK114 family)